MFERVTGDECFDLFLHAARELGVDVRFLVDESTPVAEFSYRGERALIYRNCVDLNDGAVIRLLKNKYETSQVLARHGLPAPRSVLVPRRTRMRRLTTLVADLPRPLVVKPVTGSGGKGISVNVASPRALRIAVGKARRRNRKVLVEEHVPGTDFRIVLMDGEVLDVVQRYPAFVIGDGDRSIRALIREKNERRRAAGIKYEIPIDRALSRRLRRRGLTLRSTPELGERVVLRAVCNFALGGENEKLPISDVHPDNLELFRRCLEPFPLRLAGLDFITPDIRKSHWDVGGAFNEINDAPMLSYLIGLEYDTASSIEVLRRRLKV